MNQIPPSDPLLDRGRLFFLVFSLLTVGLIIGSSMIAQAAESKDDGKDSLNKYLSVFTEVLSLVEDTYVDETTPNELIEDAFEGAMEALGPFAVYVPADQGERLDEVLAVGGSRSGLTLLKDQGVLWVLSVVEGSPAEAAGMRNGDIISGIGEEMTREMSMFEVLSVFAQDLGAPIDLQVIRSGRRFRISFELAEFEPPGVVLEAKRGVPVLRIASFHPQAAEGVRRSLAGLVGEAGRFLDLSVDGELLIDLRGAAGGEESVAYEIAGMFAQGELGALLSRGEVVEVFNEDGEPAWQGNFTVLIDRATQGPAELLATILKQRYEARLVGERSYGHSGRLDVLELSGGAAVRLTDAYYTGPDRVPLREALEPDVWARNTAPASVPEPAQNPDPIEAQDDAAVGEEEPAAPGEEEEEDPTIDNILERALDAILDEDEDEEEAAAAA